METMYYFKQTAVLL